MLLGVVRSLVKHQNEFGTNFQVVITGDHSTPVLSGDHSFEPVPFAICPVGLLQDIDTSACELHSFGEIACSRGKLGRFHGMQVMELVKQLAKCTFN